ncbi:translocation/assembly module TamB [Pragia fontium]|uniref:Translocation/assembly module TamB n=1 Tax=Pragia fontium TaxID=82985 RepID=A0ABQ5LI27_9GAMM|nr:translocation/assembly module TamB domain-containing protein [Pragia fontium]GKX63219.1 translocation/assembly module TamB [Pragia fontium]
MKIKKWIKRVIIGLLLLIVLLTGALALLLGTQTGLHLVLNNLPRVVSGLQIGRVEGGWRDLTLSKVNYAMPGIDVGVEEFHLSINFTCIPEGKICVNAVTAKDVDVKIDTAQIPASAVVEEPPSEPVTDIRTPYPIELNLLRLNNVNVTVDDIAITLNEFRTAASWQQREINIQPTNIRQLLVVLPQSTEVQQPPVAKPSQQETTGEMLAALFDKPLLASLPEVHLPMDFNLPSLIGEDLRLTGAAPIQINRLELQAATKDSHIQIQSLKVNAPEGIAALTGDASLSGNWPVNLTLNATVNDPSLKGEKVKLLVAGDVVGRLTLDVNASGPVGAQLKAETNLASAGLPLSLTLESKRVQWPLTGKSDYRVNDTRLKLDGRATDYSLSLRSAVEGTDIPPASLLVDGKGNVQQFNLSRLRLSALQGKAELSGVVDWSHAISWRSLLTIDGINTAKQWPEWPAKLNGKVTTKGSLNGGSWQLNVPEIDLNGQVKQNRLSATGALKGNDSGQWVIPGVNLALGPNTIDVKGNLANKWILDANIDAPKLTGMLPGLSGVAKGTIKLRGDAKSPQLLADLNANGLGWQDLKIAKVVLNSDITSANQVKGSLALKVSDLTQGDLNISLLSLEAEGNEGKHHLNLNINGKPVSGQLALNGSFDRTHERWKGALTNTRFNTPVGEWQISRDIALDYRNAQQTISIGSHCWRNPNAELCVPKTIEVGPSGQASLVLNRFDLAMLAPMLGKETKAQGIFTGKADVSWKAGGGLPQAKVALNGNGVAVTQMIDGRALPIALDKLTLDANMNGNRAQLNWLMKIANNGSFNGNVQVSDPQGSRNLSGNVQIDAISLALLKPALEGNEKADGMLNANLRLGGNAQSPRITGSLALEKLQLNTQWVPLVVKDSRLALNFNGTSSELNGLIQTEKGSLTLGGNADWRHIDAWRAKITAKGDRIRISMPPTVMLDVSPDIVFDATPQLLTLNGSVGIPWARISVEEVPESATGISSDEVMLDRNLRPVETKSTPIAINSNLVVSIGNNVSIKAFGLKARLQGDLKVVQDKKGLGLNGQVNIPSGQFRAYGQDLVIKKGMIQFAGPPDQPMLNLEAIRNPDATEDSVTAGVRVTGLASEPKVEIFSDPAMSQQQALSYLLRGQGLDSSGGDSDMMTSMLVGLGVAKSGKLVGQIGEAFGVKNLSLDTQGVGDSSSVVVSGYIMPGLQVKYGVGIFDSLATLTLRYRLMPRLYLEAVSGIDQALDVLYQFEF